MRTKARHTRKRRIEFIERRLLRKSAPRFQVAMILLLTGLAGFFTSFSLLHLGIPWMWLRYPAAILIAYFVFLMLLGLWLRLQRRNLDLDADLDGIDLSPSNEASSSEDFQIEGGNFAGGGAGGSWSESASSSSSFSSDGDSWKVVDLGLDLEEGWLAVLVVVAAIGGLIASLYIVYIAPALLAETLVDGVLVASLYKRVKGIERRHCSRISEHSRRSG